MKLGNILVLLLIVFGVTGLQLFLIGGIGYETSSLYVQLANAVPNRTPMPNNCIENWEETKCPKIAVITSSHLTQTEGNAAYTQDDDVSWSYKRIFLKFGMAPQHISLHADNYKDAGNISTPKGRANLKLLQQADIAFLTGGDQSFHVRAWLDDNGRQIQLLKIIRQRAFRDQLIVGGTSAGSMIYSDQTYGYGTSYGALFFSNSYGLAQKQITDADVGGTALFDIRNGTDCNLYEHNAGKMAGFNWLKNLFIDTHFHNRGRIGRIASMMVDLGLSFGVGIDENTTFFIKNNIGTVYGEHGVTVVDLSEAIKIPSLYFQIKNVKVHYLTQGDSINLNTKTVHSTKQLITVPYYNSQTDSNDIFNSYEATLLLTRLVDQKALYNVGTSKIPDDFDNGAVFELTFRKGKDTVGYKTGSAYTVQNAYIDYSYTQVMDQKKQDQHRRTVKTVDAVLLPFSWQTSKQSNIK